MDAVFSGDEQLRTAHEIAELVEVGALSPPPFRPRACRVDAAFRLMAQGKHVGKVVAFSEAFIARRAEPLRPFAVKERFLLDHRSIWRFGKVIARWLVEAGQALVQPKRPSRPEAESFVEDLRAQGGRARGQGGRQLAFGRDATYGRDSREGSAAERSVSSGDGHRRCTAQRPHE